VIASAGQKRRSPLAPSHEARALSVCLISEEYPPETGWGGIGTYAYNLARGLVELGHRVHVIARGWGEDTVEDDNGVRVHRVAVPEPSWRWGTYFVNLRFFETRGVLLWSRRVAGLIDRLCAKEPFDVIETPEYHAQGLFAALGRGRPPVVVKLHTPAFLCRQINGVGVGGSAWDTAISERLEHWLARRARLVTSPSRRLATDVAAHWRLRPSAVRVIPNPIDEEMFCPDGPAADNRTILYVGRIERRKGVETLIDALPEILRSVPNARLRLVGKDHPSGPGGSSLSDHLRQRLRDSGVPAGAVEFAGPVDRTELPHTYRGAAVCVVPSLYENFPYTCLEAMACGSAVVASAVGGIPEIVTDLSDGLLVPPTRPDALAGAAIQILTDGGLRRRLGSQARATVTGRFSRQVVCARTADAYRSLVSREPWR
jgi:glycosyltransferase involved in cell wall biosynthesis